MEPSGQFILHIEDDEGSALLVQVALSEVGANVRYRRVHDARQALAYLDAAMKVESTTPKPDLILLDLNLPGNSGFEVLSAVRAAPFWAPTPVVVFTSSAARHDMETASALNATKYILKPSTFEGYLAMIKTLLGLLSPDGEGQPVD